MKLLNKVKHFFTRSPTTHQEAPTLPKVSIDNLNPTEAFLVSPIPLHYCAQRVNPNPIIEIKTRIPGTHLYHVTYTQDEMPDYLK
jgi:hypothetical protein